MPLLIGAYLEAGLLTGMALLILGIGLRQSIPYTLLYHQTLTQRRKVSFGIIKSVLEEGPKPL